MAATASPRYIRTPDVAKLIRAELKEVFTGITFSVKSSSYAGGSSITVSWTDGPTEDMVNKIIDKYAGASFDGMQDLKTHHDSVLNGERVSFSCDYVHGNRRLSGSLRLRLAERVARYWGVEITISPDGGISNDTELFKKTGYWGDTLVYQWSRKRAIVPAGVVWKERAIESKGARAVGQKPAPAVAIIFRNYATKQAEKAFELRQPRLENTWKRAEQASHNERKAQGCELLCRAANGLAELYEEAPASVPAILAGFTTGAALADLATYSRYPDLYVRADLLWGLLDGGYGPNGDRQMLWPYFNNGEGGVRQPREDAGVILHNLDDVARLSRICKDVPESDHRGYQAKSWAEHIAPARRLRVAGITRQEEHDAAREALYELAARKDVLVDPEVQRGAVLRGMLRDLVGDSFNSYHPTPPDVIDQVLEMADIRPGMFVLEPSAGSGDIADAVRTEHPDASIDVIEIAYKLRAILEFKQYRIVGGSFLDFNASGQYDRVLMNPPFNNGEYAVHLHHAYKCLAPGGRMVAIVPAVARTAEKVNAWLHQHSAHWIELEKDAFTYSTRPVPTPCAIVTIDKPGCTITVGVA